MVAFATLDWIVLGGLQEGERVIVNGIQKVRPGLTVVASPVAAVPHQEGQAQ